MIPARPRSALLAAAALAALTGCAAVDTLFGDPPPPVCPRVGVVPDAERVTRFRPGPGRDILDIRHTAEIVAVRSVCDSDFAKDGSGVTTMALAVTVAVERGPADADRRGTLAYFVATPQFYPRPEGRQTFEMAFAFEGNLGRIEVTDDPIEITLPFSAEQTGRDFEIVVGFSLTPEELAHNRSQRPADRAR
ncbi:MAG: hypothetical protein FJX53_13165 [Alphaproteobacteria bacterium]|nr:hypothetical protein [Alphaproteobacteria bacterium]